MFVNLGVNIFAAQKALYGTVIAAGVASLIAGAEGLVNVSLGAEGFTADRVDNRMAVAADVLVFVTETLQMLQDFHCRVFFERLAKQIIQTLGAIPVVHAILEGCGRRQRCRLFGSTDRGPG